ncbi:ribose transport system ATP-binding protein [Aliiroseovarius halocynthiae]|uniref:Sugar ABC transporter ATP-binding protein n=1 Tax=Aliiroseovarius halocynthiae TaxID=985055 RepID=A0A545SN93_9RHOB|nr:sugar ABC transporter ATP-binding protein [Aliiroseovarius halocynthiae]TQV66462.1 sugar ABC transporter ATP-binding protein [Aliiroseovarius halocynthiae]SMR83614.1 ribose transport system ATP-binding protein [Aliiroseovarius halocynthiae]
MSGEILLETREVSKRFGNFVALKSASIAVTAGKVIGFVGSNGAGKSTLIKVITGAHAPSSGSVHVRGKEVHKADPALMRALGVACIYQHSSLVATLSVIENVFLGREMRGRLGLVSHKAQRVQLQEIMDDFGIHVDPDVLVSTLTPVKQKEVEILKALVANADVILMDEPTAWLSLSEVSNLHTTIRKLTAANKGVVYISHVLDEVFQICDDITILRDGTMAWTGPEADIDRPKLVNLMVGEALGEASRAAVTSERRPRGTGTVKLATDKLSKQGVFHDVTFEVNAGEILCFAGLIGSRRSEVVKCLFGDDKPTSGTIISKGGVKTFGSPAEAIANGICLVPEDRHTEGLCLSHTTFENTVIPSLVEVTNRGVLMRKDMDAMCTRQITSLNILPPDPAKVVGQMSGGNQQKVLLGKWIEKDPEVLILDEPTVGVDVGAKAEIYAIIRKLRDEGAAVIVVSSDLEEVMTIADRILVFSNGEITTEFDAGEVTNDLLIHAIGGGESA